MKHLIKSIKNIPLRYKILSGYLVVVAVIVCMVAILFHERRRVVEIEDDTYAIHRIQRHGHVIHRHITLLATYGETSIVWDEEDYREYHVLRLHVDSLIRSMVDEREEFVRQGQIDTLCSLLASKEEHLFQLMQLFRERDEVDSLLFNRLPTVLRQAERPRTVTRKKKGLRGLFGAKETVQLPPDATSIHTLNRELLSIQEEYRKDIGIYTDSLRGYNKELNRKLRALITTMNEQTERVLETKETHLKASYERSILIVSCLVLSAVVLLFQSYLVILRDIRKREKGRKRLEETIDQNTVLLEMRKNIILTISHDIRAPLNIIGGSAELAMDTREKKRRNTHLDNIRTVCKHVVHLLNNLLDVYRLNETKETRNDVPFNLKELLERTSSGFSHVINNKGILFKCDFKGTKVRLFGDVDRIEQIIDNLLTNAVKFTESGTIRFNVRYHDGKLFMEITDTGIGMSKDTLSRIFRPFERHASASNTQGYGLGLPITQGLVNLLGGTIEVSSRVGHGTTFRVTLPLPVTDEPIESENRIVPHPMHLPQNVLVIDDDAMQRDVVKEMLERNGVTCTACSSAKEVVKMIRSRNYDLLLSDIQMPGTNGFELLTLLRNSNIGNSHTIPVVAMTARGDREKDAFLDAGFTDCIYKPFSSSELLSLLSSVKRCRAKEKQRINLDALLYEAGDKVKLLCSFIDQSKQDLEDLDVAVKNGKRDRLREVVHRMQPVWELLRMEDMLSDYRMLLKDDNANESAVKEYTRQVMECAAMLIAEAENELKRLKDETENTDS